MTLFRTNGFSDQWYPFRTNGFSDKWYPFRTNGSSDQWVFGPMGHRTNGFSDQWAVGPMGFRTNGLSDRRHGTIFVCYINIITIIVLLCILYIQILYLNVLLPILSWLTMCSTVAMLKLWSRQFEYWPMYYSTNWLCFLIRICFSKFWIYL